MIDWRDTLQSGDMANTIGWQFWLITNACKLRRWKLEGHIHAENYVLNFVKITKSLSHKRCFFQLWKKYNNITCTQTWLNIFLEAVSLFLLDRWYNQDCLSSEVLGHILTIFGSSFPSFQHRYRLIDNQQSDRPPPLTYWQSTILCLSVRSITVTASYNECCLLRIIDC